MMKKYIPCTGWLVPCILLALTFTLDADDVFVGGPRRHGYVRTPLRINANPSTSVYYSPAQIRHAYGFDQLTADGTGQKIAIVDAYGNGSIQADLTNFCAQFGLPNTTVQIIGANATIDTGWALETALDVEWAHAIATNATIILSVAPTPSTGDLLNAVKAAVNAGANVVSMSWGTTEFSGETNLDSYFQASGVTFVASSGDSGELSSRPEVEWPAVSPYVVSVGGTSLLLDTNNVRTSETAWPSSGGGLSSYYSIPGWQSGWMGYATRGVPDVSYDADPNTGVLVYDAANGGWYSVGGTSAGAPQWAAAIALANQSRAVGVSGNADIYNTAGTAPNIKASNFCDITSGNNGSDPDDISVIGYDLVTGLGSPAAAGLIPALVALSPRNPDFSLSLAPSSQTTSAGANVSYTVTVTSSGGFAEDINLSVTLPSGASGGTFTVSPIKASSGTSVLTFTAPVSTGSFTVTVTGTSALSSRTHTASATLSVQKPDFAVAASPSSRSVRHGTSTSYTANVSSLGGFTSTVSMTATISPVVSSGPTLSFSPTQITGGSGSSQLTVRTSSSTPRRSYTITITGTNGTTQHSSAVSLSVR
jgi:subtilase family serine protease